jgi:sugar phosphate isomerase/epimerase
VEIGLTPDSKRSDASFAVAAAAGFTTMGRIIGQADEPFPCHELLGLQVGPDPAANDALAAQLAEEAAASGASWVLATFQADPTPDVARWAAMFGAAGSGLAVEPSPLWGVATIDDALVVLDLAAPARAGVIIDVWNFSFGPDSWEDLERMPLDAIAYVQFTDALEPLGPVDLHEALYRRALPGEGVLELDRFVSTLRDRGWDGIVSMQVLSDELRQLPFDEYARRVHAAGARYGR